MRGICGTMKREAAVSFQDWPNADPGGLTDVFPAGLIPQLRIAGDRADDDCMTCDPEERTVSGFSLCSAGCG